MKRSRFLGWPAIALAVFASVALLHMRGQLRRVEFQLADFRDRALQHESPSDIVVVGIDARSIAELQRWPWPRHIHADLIDTLAKAAPRQLFLDIDFSSPSQPAEDAALAAALARWPHAPITLAAFFQRASDSDTGLLLTQPLPAFASHVRLVAVNVVPDEDGLIRRFQSHWDTEAGQLPAAPLLLSGVDTGALRELQVDYSIAPSSFKFISYSDLLSGEVDRAELKGKSIFVGATAVELGDNLAVPLHRSLPGVAVLALASQSAINGALQPLPGNFYLLAGAVWSLLCAWLFARLSWRWNLVAVAVSVPGWALVAAALFLGPRVVLQLMPFLLTTVLGFGLTTLRSLDEQTVRALGYALGIRRRDAVLRSIVDSSADSIIGVDAGCRIHSANPAALRLLGRSAEQVTGMCLADILPALPREAEAANALLTALANRVSEWEIVPAQGARIPVELSIGRVELGDEQLYTVIVRDISERKMQQRRLEYQAMHDPLTDLPNRHALDAQLQRLRGGGAPDELAVMALDLCRFKEVNDVLGHGAGDQVLVEVARRFRAAIGTDVFLARVGGDEFTIVARGCTDRALAALAERLAASLRPNLLVHGVPVDLDVSIGISRLGHDAGDEQTLVQHADVAMYVCKRRGSAFEHYDPTHDQYSARKLSILSGLREAILHSQLRLHYQPKVHLGTDRVEGVEALMRWRHPTLGVVSPGEFMAIAESTDLIGPLTDWTLAQAVACVSQWREQGVLVNVAVNLSARVLQDTALPLRIATLLEANPQASEFLELEITESAMMFDAGRAMQVIERIRALGLRISVDDYGTGFASLGYLRDLPVQTLKLDKSFVTNLRTREDNQVIVASTIQMAHALKLSVVAEGVEDEWETRFLQSAGCDHAQGFWYTQALPADDCLDWIRRYNSRPGVRGDVALSVSERLLAVS
jgi:diguanylate cyclase (GGDEF)-like protein/PAS domain S-box-containing protein